MRVAAELDAPSPPSHELLLGLRSLRLVVLVFILIDVLSGLVATSAGLLTDARSTTGETLQALLTVSACAAAMWCRRGVTAVLVAAAIVVVLTFGPSGDETTVLYVVTGMAAAGGSRHGVASRVLVCLGAVLVWAVAFGLFQEHYHPGWGPAAAGLVLVVGLLGVATGLVARVLLAADGRRGARVAQLERENAQIAAEERRRLADELQDLVTAGLRQIETQLAELDAPGAQSDLDRLRRGLARIDALSRSLLNDLRALLEILRSAQDPRPVALSGALPPVHWLGWIRPHIVQVAATVGFAALSVQAGAMALVQAPTVGLWIEALALAACGLALWPPWGTRVGIALAASTLPLAVLGGDRSGWEALSVALLSLICTARFGLRRIWWVPLGLVAYGSARWLSAAPDDAVLVPLLIPVAYAGLTSAVVGLAVGDFLRARSSAEGRRVALLAERDRLELDERSALARELHDVVARQLSITTMLVMGSTGSTDPAELRATLGRIADSTRTARSELDVLLHTMRGASADEVRLGPLISPLSTAAALEHQLQAAGYGPLLEVDPAVETLDASSQRTLTRIMQEATTNIVRYAPSGASCRFVVALDDAGLTLSIASPLGGQHRRSPLSLGWGLRGIQERVELTHGTFHAGPDQGQWVVRVTLPTESAAVLSR